MTPPALSLHALPSPPAGLQTPGYAPKDLPIGIVHFGPGAFHRAHQAAFIDTLCAHDPRWGICGVSLQSAGVRDALQPQQGLYTLAVLDAERHYRWIGSLRELLVAPEDPPAVFERLRRPAVQLVTCTVTEKGYCLGPDGLLDLTHPDIAHDLAQPRTPRSLPGYLVEGLRQRRAAGLAPFVLMPCDNLPANGRKLKAALVRLAVQADAGLAAWVEQQLVCPSTMVDAITPATDEALRQQVAQATGWHDAWPVQREAFAQWVIEAHPHPGGPDWARAGAVLTPDVAAYERAKLWLLNGPHSALAYAGLLRGYETVGQAMADPALAAWVRGYMQRSVLPLLAAEGLALGAYAEAICARFANPALQHRLAQIAQDGSHKLRLRIVAPLQEALARGGAGAELAGFALPLAAWLRYLRQQQQAGAAVIDPLAPQLMALAAQLDDTPADVDALMALEALVPPALRAHAGLRSALATAYQALLLAHPGLPAARG